jgi:3,4-dihydroxy 2-butanone 4-phosphate synthase/GTP cyclohydrolase II
MTIKISPILDIIADIQAGKMVVLMDAEDRENEGDLVMAASHVRAEDVNFMATHARGLICLTLTEERCDKLNISLMVNQNGTPYGTNFTASIEAATGVTTGISAADRARTIQVAVARNAKPADIVQPGHVFPIKAQKGGVLIRAGHTEAGCDLAALAGLEPASVICEIMNADGSMARLPELLVFAEQHGLKIGTIADLIHYRSQTENLIEHLSEKSVSSPFGEFVLHTFRDTTTDLKHYAYVKGAITPTQPTLVRVHEPLSVMDFLDPDSSGRSWNIPQALTKIQTEGGVVILLSRETPLNHELPTANRWDGKSFGVGAQMLKHLGARQLHVLGSPASLPSVKGFDLEVLSYTSH